MTTQVVDRTVKSSIVVDAPIERAFSVFTDDIGSWWPSDHHVLEAELAQMVFEPRVGGHVYDVGVDGSECRWARVLAYEPPNRLLISWDINLQWQIETDLEKTSEVEVRFIAEGRRQPASSSSTATSTATATAGRGCVTRSARLTAGKLGFRDSPRA